ncbi:hypothetical protein EYC84_007117 [Monilinia fructicola]|uniref:Uncharacterized protein n=1 Tax=Monilinia fructicola TaxID=38448 RepID=A0A5M9K5L2_MONFR|nr:hypothetical protein EYC84_007117 [Monilinia fructicola]
MGNKMWRCPFPPKYTYVVGNASYPYPYTTSLKRTYPHKRPKLLGISTPIILSLAKKSAMKSPPRASKMHVLSCIYRSRKPKSSLSLEEAR